MIFGQPDQGQMQILQVEINTICGMAAWLEDFWDVGAVADSICGRTIPDAASNWLVNGE